MKKDRIYWTLKGDGALHFDGTLEQALAIAEDLEDRWHAQGQVGEVGVVGAWPKKGFRFSIWYAGIGTYEQYRAVGLDPNWDRCGGPYVRDDVRISAGETV